MSQLEVNKIVPQSGTSLTYGDSGDTFQIPSGVTLDIASGGTIDATGATITGFDAASDEKVKISSNDTTPGFLNGKLTAGANITLTEGSDGGDETLSIALSGTIPDARFPATLPAASGVNLTALNASNLGSGTVPTARLGSGTASSSTFLAGDQTFKTVTGTTINNNADNRLITGSGTANTLEGEAKLTFDGSILNNAQDASSASEIKSSAGSVYTKVIADDATGFSAIDYSHDLRFKDAGTEKARFDTNGNFLVAKSNTTRATAGFEFRDGGFARFTRDQNNPLEITRTTDFGDVIKFYADNSQIGQIGLASGSISMGKTSGASFSIGGDAVYPNVNNSYDLGSTTAVWRNIYTSDFHMTNEGLDKGNDVDGTKGSWTFQEGAEDLFLLNNKNGKKYKFKLEECK